MTIYKNAQENADGSIDCLILLDGEWVPTTQDPAMEYGLSEELEADDWSDIKPCPQSEKDAHEQEWIKRSKLQSIEELENTQTKRLLRGAALGDQSAIDKLRLIEQEIEKIRSSL